MGKLKPRSRVEAPKEVAKVSLKSIVKPKDKQKVTAVVPAKKELLSDFPKRPALPALKRKQKAKQQQKGNATSAGPRPSPTAPHQKKHVKLAEKRKKLIQKFEMILEEQKETRKQAKIDRANKKIGSVATMGAIKDALPSLDSLLKFKGSDMKTGIPEYDSIKTKAATGKAKKQHKESKLAIKEKRITKQSQEMTQRYDYLQKLMSDKVFLKNPRQVIAQHIKNTKLEQEAADQNKS